MIVYREVYEPFELEQMLYSERALENLHRLDYDEVERIIDYLDIKTEWSYEELDDFFYFELDTIANVLGYNSEDEFLASRQKEYQDINA